MNLRTVFTGLALVVPCALVALTVGACSSEGTTPSGSGTAQFVVVPEDSIPEGVAAGSNPDQIKDGWKVSYDKFLISIADLVARRSDTGEQAAGGDLRYVLDLKNAPTSGYVLAEFKGIAAAR